MKNRQNEAIVTPRGQSSMYAYAPLAHGQPKEFIDMTGEVCEVSEAIEEAAKATKQ